MFSFMTQKSMTQKHKRKQAEEKKQASETHSGITQTLEVSYQEFKITMVNMIRALESTQHLSTDRLFKQRGGNTKEE